MNSPTRFIFGLFAILTLILPSTLPHAFAASVIYNGFSWTSDFCTGVVLQSFIDGEDYPNNGIDFLFRPQSDTLCLRINKGVDCETDLTEPCWYEGSFTIDYQNYAILTSASSNDNTSIIGEFGDFGEDGLAFNTSVTHLANNQALLTWDWRGTAYSSFHYGNSVLGQIVPCEGYFNINADSEYSFIMQMRNVSTIDLWLGNSTYAFQRWCSLSKISGGEFAGYKTGGMTLSYLFDDGPGAGTGNMELNLRGVLQGFGCVSNVVHEVFVSQVNLDCDAPAGQAPLEEQEAGEELPQVPPQEVFDPDEVSGSLDTRIVLLVRDINGTVRNEFSSGQLVRLTATLQNISDVNNIENIPDMRIHFYRGRNVSIGQTVLGTALTNAQGLAEIITTPIGNIGDFIEYNATFVGSLSLDLQFSTSVTFVSLKSQVTTGIVSTSLIRPLFFRVPDDGSSVNTIIHGENLVIGSKLTDENGLPVVDRTIFYYLDKNNTGTFERFQLSCQTDNTGSCLTRAFSFGTTWVSTSRVFASFDGDAFYLGTNSSIDTFILASSIADFELSIEIEPAQLLSQERFEVRVRLVTTTNGIETPITNEFVRVWWATDSGNFIRIINSNVDINGRLIRGFNAPEQIGIYNIKANATINSVVVQTSNSTLTVLADLLQIPGVELPDGGQPGLGSLVSGLPDFGFGGIILWVVTFLMFAIGINVAFAKIFSIGNVDMPALFPILITTLMFGISIVLGSAFGWLTLQQIVIIVAPMALISGILISSKLRGNNNNG